MATPDLSLLPRRRPGYAPVHGDPEHLVLDMSGEYDMSTVEELAKSLARALALDSGELVIDLSGVQFLSVATCRLLMRADALLRARSRALSLRAPSRAAWRVLGLCGMTHMVEPRSDRAGEHARPEDHDGGR